MEPEQSSFLWDADKERLNVIKHGVDFTSAVQVFRDPHRKIVVDFLHSLDEERYFCLGRVQGKVLTVRFLYRDGCIRIIGAGYWRKGAKLYDQKDQN